MTYGHLFSLLTDSKLSPEQFGDYLGVAGMTLRRWRKAAPTSALPRKYETALIDAMSRLLALSNLGLTLDSLKEASSRPDAMVDVLSRIGMDVERQRQVDRSSTAYTYFQKLGRAWKQRISVLRTVIISKELMLTDKLVAYGALFYLISPIQLLPNYIPVVGLLDDYAILVIAAAYYVRRFGSELKESLELDPDLSEA
jgi:uncharacterized membrane protein YkvA (DUF1232 family)